MDLWKLLTLVTAAGVVWLVLQERKKQKDATMPTSLASSQKVGEPSVAEQVAKLLNADLT